MLGDNSTFPFGGASKYCDNQQDVHTKVCFALCPGMMAQLKTLVRLHACISASVRLVLATK